jgi:hypothetical protein
MQIARRLYAGKDPFFEGHSENLTDRAARWHDRRRRCKSVQHVKALGDDVGPPRGPARRMIASSCPIAIFRAFG